MTDWPTQPAIDPFDFTEGATVTDADTFIREHHPSFDYTRAGEYVAVCAGCTRAAGDYVEWPCGDVWAAFDTLARSADLLAEAERRGAERAVEIVRCLPGHTHIPPPEDEPWEHYGSIAIWDAGDYADALAEALRAGDDQ